MPDYTKGNGVNCLDWVDTGHPKGGQCTSSFAVKHFRWTADVNTPSKGTCVNCPARRVQDESQPVILGIIAKSVIPPQAPKQDVSRQSWWARQKDKDFGPALWRDLHKYAAIADLSVAEKWLQAFALRLPCGDCRSHFLKMIKESPPVLTSNQEFAFSTFQWHNLVNVRKENPSPEITWDEAVDIQGWPVEWKTVNE